MPAAGSDTTDERRANPKGEPNGKPNGKPNGRVKGHLDRKVKGNARAK